MNPNLTWNKDIPDPDPFSVINILARRQLHRGKTLYMFLLALCGSPVYTVTVSGLRPQKHLHTV